MSPIEGRIDGGDAQRRLRGLSAQLLDWRPFWPIAGRIARSWVKRQFESQGSFGGTPWAPLTMAYAKEKTRKRPGRPLLVYDGDLRRDVLGRYGLRLEGQPTAFDLVLRNEVAAYHQTGTGAMPARPIIPPIIPPEAKQELRVAAQTYVDAITKRWGF